MTQDTPRCCKVCASPLAGRRLSYCGTICKAVSEKARARRRYEADREAWIEQSRQWKIANPDRARELARDFAQRNRERTAAREREYRAANRARYNEHKRNWYLRDLSRGRELGRLHASRRRALMAGAGVFEISPRDLARVASRLRDCCAYCGQRVNPSTGFDWDHIVPLSRGGRHSIGNLTVACIPCNRSKSSRLVSEWRRDVRQA